MAEQPPSCCNNMHPLVFAAECIRRDKFAVLLIALIFAAAGIYGAWRKPQAASTAQLVLSGIPVYTEDQSDIDDLPTRVLAVPMDVKSAAILCMSDEAVRRTQEALGGASSIGIASLRGALRCEVSIAAESPMRIEYSPILKLTAHAATPEEAKRRADAWAETCVDISREFRAKRQGTIADAFQRALDEFEGTYGRLEAGASTPMYRAYEELFARATFARVGADGSQPELQMLSAGAEWPIHPTRGAVKAGLTAALCGLIAGLALSLGLRFAATLRPHTP